MADQSKSRRNGAPAWLMTFADLMALLFALFVLILSFSDVDSDSFKRNAGPMAEAFNQIKPRFITPIETSPHSSQQIPQQTLQPEMSLSQNTYLQEVTRNKIVNLIQSTITTELNDNLLELVVRDNRIIMRFPSHTAFRAGNAKLSASIYSTLDQIADILARTEGNITITGHTDNSPISTAKFRSNWELSTSRAASVIQRLLRHPGLNPKRVTAVGRADTHPLVANNSAENRKRNRRVEILVEIPTNLTPR